MRRRERDAVREREDGAEEGQACGKGDEARGEARRDGANARRSRGVGAGRKESDEGEKETVRLQLADRDRELDRSHR